jgi:hypothetical protein
MSEEGARRVGGVWMRGDFVALLAARRAAAGGKDRVGHVQFQRVIGAQDFFWFQCVWQLCREHL